MNLVKNRTRLFGIAFLMAVAIGSYARPQASYAIGTSIGHGDGSLRWDGHKFMQVDRIELILKRDYTFDMHVIGRDRHRMYGSWSPQSSHSVRIDVNNALGDRRAYATGTVSFSNQLNTISRVELSGHANRDPFWLSFSSRRFGGGFNEPGIGNRPGQGFINYRHYGEGTFSTARGRTIQLWEIDARILPNRQFVITLSGQYSYSFQGTWTQRTANSLDLRIEQALGDRRASGSGTLIYSSDRRAIQRLFVSGYANSDRFMAQFDGSRPFGGYVLDLNRVVAGRGEIRDGGRRFAILAVEVVLRRDGRFTSRWRDDRGSFVFEGTYSLVRGDEVHLHVSGAFGRRATGQGALRLTRDGRSFTEMNLQARVENRDVRATFRAR